MSVSAAAKIQNYEDFARVHALLLAASGLPPPLHRHLFHKLSSETFDAGDFFRIDHDGPQRKLVLTSDSMVNHSNVFLVDHAWTFRLSDAYRQLLEVPGLAERMASIMCVDGGESEADGNEAKTALEVVESEIGASRERGEDSVRWLEFDELGIDDDLLSSLNLANKFPGLVALSLCGNKLENVDVVFEEVTKFKDLRALWLNNNPVVSKCGGQLTDKVLQQLPNLEIYNSKFTPNYGNWALGFCADVYDKENPGVGNIHEDNSLQGITSLDLSDRGIRNLITKEFSPIRLPALSYLNIRGNPWVENPVDDLFRFLSGFPSLQSLEVDIPGPLGESALEILEHLPKISVLNGVMAPKILEQGKHIIDSKLQPRLPEWTANEPLTDRVLNAMWLNLMTYRLANDEKIDETSVWYVMDELGSALRHSDEPNFRVAPFLYMPEGTFDSAVSYSILWPTQDVKEGDECTRDFLAGIGEDKQRSARLTAWFHTPENYFIQKYERHWNKLQSGKITISPEKPSLTKSLLRDDGCALRVYTDIPHVEENLTRPEFVLTNEPKDADIIWTGVQVDEDMKKATGITENQFVNQFPFEACIVMKHHLAETIQKAHGAPQWIQPTYNLDTHLSELIGDYYARKIDGRNNLWILKPWNMARTIDTTVTENLTAIIRLMETGPKICQKYIEHPALFNGKKFDVRYIVLVRSMQPLEIFLSDIFWVRMANNPYSLDQHSLFEYETHFTVMNYRGILNHKNTPEFVKEFEQEHQVKWLDIHERVRTMICSVFEAAAAVHPEMHNTTSRAIYGLDVMLDSSFQPKLLEVTYCPDCTRACKYDTAAILGDGETIKGRDFFNDVFGCLFLSETTHVSPL